MTGNWLIIKKWNLEYLGKEKVIKNPLTDIRSEYFNKIIRFLCIIMELKEGQTDHLDTTFAINHLEMRNRMIKCLSF